MRFRNRMILFPEGRSKALTMSYDDGVLQDKRLVDIFNKYGIKGTFNLNSGFFGQEDEGKVNGIIVDHSHIPASEIQEVYKNHEVAIHTLRHPNLEKLPKEVIIYEVIEDKKNLEELVGYPVRGMAYPFGTYNENVIKILKDLNIEYSRTVNVHHSFELPNNFLEWQATCHHGDQELFDLTERFLSSDSLSLFYVWGHSYEFDVDDSWDTMEEFCKKVGNNSDIWYATNIQIVDYVNAVNSLKFSCTGSSVYNPSGLDVWISVNGIPQKIEKASTSKIKL